MSDIVKDSGWEYQWTVSCGTWPGKKTFFWIELKCHGCYIYMFTCTGTCTYPFWRMLLHMALMGTHFIAAEAIGVLTNVSPVIHMEAFGWDVNNCFSPHADRKELDRGEVSGIVLSFVHLSFSLLEIVNPIWYRRVAKNQGLKSEACLKQLCANLSHVIHSEGFGMGVSMNSFFP